MEAEGDGYDELDDDFVACMTGGKEVIREKSYKEIWKEKEEEEMKRKEKMAKKEGKKDENK